MPPILNVLICTVITFASLYKQYFFSVIPVHGHVLLEANVVSADGGVVSDKHLLAEVNALGHIEHTVVITKYTG